MRMKAAIFIFCFYYYPVLSPVVYQNEYVSKGLRYPRVAEGVCRANLKILWADISSLLPPDLLRLTATGAVALSSAQTSKGDEDSVPSPGLLIPAQTLDDCLPSLQLGKKAPWECCSVLLPSHMILGQVCLESVWSDISNNVLSSVVKAIMIRKECLTQQKLPKHEPICKLLSG